MIKNYGVIIQTTRNDSGSFFAMNDTCHDTLEAAMAEAGEFLNEESVTHIAGYRHKVMGIFALDTVTGDIEPHLNRKQLINLIELGEQEQEREEADERRYGSYADQHRLTTFEVGVS